MVGRTADGSGRKAGITENQGRGTQLRGRLHMQAGEQTVLRREKHIWREEGRSMGEDEEQHAEGQSSGIMRTAASPSSTGPFLASRGQSLKFRGLDPFIQVQK